MEYRVPISASIAQETLRKLDRLKEANGEKRSRGEVIDKAVALYAESAKREASK